MKSSKGTVQLVATKNIFYEDINSHERRITWRCSKFYTKTPDRDRCQVSICLRSGLIAYVKGRHNHPDTFIEAKHASRRCEVDMTGKYKITGLWMAEKKPSYEKKNPDIKVRMKDTSKYKMQRSRGLQNLTQLNMQLTNMMASQVLLPIPAPPEPVLNNSNNIVGPVTSTTAEPLPSEPEQPVEKDVSWHIPTFEGFF